MESSSRIFNLRHRDALQRFGASFSGRVLCVILLLLASLLLFWNEGEAVYEAALTARSHHTIREYSATHGFDEEEEEEEDKEEKEELVHVVGPLYTVADVHDKEFGVEVRAVKLRRKVEMFQWVEHVDTRELDDNGQINPLKKYSYTKEWRSTLFNSSVFARHPEHHKNPQRFLYPSRTLTSPLVKVKGLTLSEGLVNKIDFFRPYYVEEVPYHLGFQRSSGYLYRSQHPYSPVIGDLRVTFDVAGVIGETDEMVSIIARKDKDRLIAFPSEDGTPMELLYPGRLSVEEMLERSVQVKVALRWAIRLSGWLLIFLACSALSKPIERCVGSMPLVSEALFCGRTVFSVLMSAAVVGVVCAARWIVFRPAFSLLSMTAAVSPFVVIAVYRRRQSTIGQHHD